MPRMKGADLITEHLVRNKIPYVFGICGHGNVGMLDSLYEARDRIKLVSPRHEQVAAHMADAYFRVRHEAGGDAHLLRPRLRQHRDAARRRAVGLLGVARDHRQRADLSSSTAARSRRSTATTRPISPTCIRPVVKRSFQPTRVDMLPLALRQATTTMLSGRPGPVNVDVPFNVFQEEDDVEVPPASPPHGAQRSGASPEEIAAALDMILAAERPVLFIGHGVTLAEASAELTALRAQARHSGDLLAQRHGLPRHDRSALARLHRPQRRLSRPTRPAAMPTW